MTEQTIKPEKITKPIQLLGAWLAGLFSVDSCFLFAASNMENGSFESISLIIASIINVPLFLLAVFLLQTKFRPELQEDSYYSTYLSQKTKEPVVISKTDAKILELTHKISSLEEMLIEGSSSKSQNENSLEGVLVGINKYLDNKQLTSNTLSKYGIHGFSTFGTEALTTQQSVAISEYLPKNLTSVILQIAKEAGFTHYGFFDNKAEETDEEILFGSYGTADYEIT